MRKQEIATEGNISGVGTSNVVPLWNNYVCYDCIINCDRNNHKIVENYGGPLRVVKTVFFSLEGEYSNKKQTGCYSGIYGYGYERIYVPMKGLLLAALVAFLCGLVFSYKGFEGGGGKGVIFVFSGWLCFVIALSAASWLIAGDHNCLFPWITESATISSKADVSATRYRRAEDIRFIPVVIAPFELGDHLSDDMRDVKFDIREIRSRIELIERGYPIIFQSRSIESRLSALERA